MFETFKEVLGMPSVWTLMAILFVLGWIMQRIINSLALMCQSVHVVHVPWGIMWVTIFAYLFGFISYKQTVILAILYLSAYPSMWWLNYKFTAELRRIFKQKQITKGTTGRTIWAEEIYWIWQIKRFWRRLFRSTLDEEIVDRILSYNSDNGHHYAYHSRIEAVTRDD